MVEGAVWQSEEFEDFYRRHEPGLRRALVARFGRVTGADAAQLAMKWALEHRASAESLHHPVAYLFRVGVSKIVEHRSYGVEFLEVDQLEIAARESFPDLDLVHALRELTSRQRSICLLVHGLGWTQAEVAEGLGISPATVQDHLARALVRLRQLLSDDDEGEP